MRTWLKLIIVSIAFLLSTNAARAGEGGSSYYIQGAYGDFQAGVMGAPGTYVRENVFLLDADIGVHSRGGKASLGIDEKLWINLVTIAHTTDFKILGARYGFAVNFPYILNADVSGTVAVGGYSAFGSQTMHDFADIAILPMMLAWDHGNNHFIFEPIVYIPTASYDPNESLNPGRNYWAFDINGAYTWMNPESMQELSVVSGIIFNTENPDTDYRSGAEFHLDMTAVQYIAKGEFGVGFAGYYYQQLSGDHGTVTGPINPSDIQGMGVGIGPTALYNGHIGASKFSVIGKALFDIDTTDRFKGNLYMLSVAFKL